MSVIKLDSVGKKYLINQQQIGRYLTMRDKLDGLIKNPVRFATSLFKRQEDFWALRDVCFQVEKGETIGIIGSNGAGKSTLLKILSKISPPTTGRIEIKGRVGSLLEVGTGFHPELSGRENIFLNGAILGMKRQEIVKKFDEIVSFAGIEKFLDTPVKYYSSGMYVRLAFSVAAHLEPDILIIDEVLAVGDADFQSKCLGKMEEITRKEGRTIIIVSHNMGVIRILCQRAVLLKGGKIVQIGNAEKVVDDYLFLNSDVKPTYEFALKENQDVNISKISILNNKKIPSAELSVDECFYVEVNFEVFKKVEYVVLCLIFWCNGEMLLVSTQADKDGNLLNFEKGKYLSRIEVPGFTFNLGRYELDVSIQRPFEKFLDRKQNIIFEIKDGDKNGRKRIFKGNVCGKMSALLKFETEKYENM